MSGKGRLVRWYLRLSRIFGIFPLSRSACGILRYSVCSLPTIISITYAGSYTICMLHYMYYALNEQQNLSYRLTVIPNVVISVCTDYLTRIASMYYSNDLLKFLALTDNAKSNGKAFKTSLKVMPIVYPVLSLIVRRVFLGTETQVSARAMVRDTVWDGPHAFWVGLGYFLRDGAFWSVLCFVFIFAQRLVACFEVLCADVVEHCRSTTQHVNVSPSVVIHMGTKSEESYRMERGSGFGEQLLDSFVRLKLAVDIYSKVSGAFFFALVADVGTWLFYLACRVLFANETATSTTAFTITVTQSLLVVSVLLSISELGHQIKCEV